MGDWDGGHLFAQQVFHPKVIFRTLLTLYNPALVRLESRFSLGLLQRSDNNLMGEDDFLSNGCDQCNT